MKTSSFMRVSTVIDGFSFYKKTSPITYAAFLVKDDE